MKRHASIFNMAILTIMAVLLLAGCEQDNQMPVARTLTVSVDDGTGAKTITPEGNVNVSHYVIGVSNGEISQSSGMLTKGATYTVMNLPVGTWTATVDAYVENDAAADGYVQIATATSQPFELEAGKDTSVTVTLDTLLQTASGDVTITLKLPSVFEPGDRAYARWTLKGTDREESIAWSQAPELLVSDDGTATLVLDADSLMGSGTGTLTQGVWTITVEVSDSRTVASQSIVCKGVEVMRLLAGLPATGTIDLSGAGTGEGGLEIEDQTGGILEPGAVDVVAEEGVTTITVAYDEVPLDAEVRVFIDGEEISTSTSTDTYYSVTDMTDGRVFSIYGLSTGEHDVMISFSDGTLTGTGSVTVKVWAKKTLAVGDVVSVDGIEVLVLAALADRGTWESTEGATGSEYIGVDRNHDLSYYLEGDDFVNVGMNNSAGLGEGKPKYGYEWGGNSIITGVFATAVGTGLANTESLIKMNLLPDTADWPVLWNKVEEFRQSHSDKWFVPSHDELVLVLQQKANLINVSDSHGGSPYYWSSSEISASVPSLTSVWYAKFDYQNTTTSSDKGIHVRRVRLCVQFTPSDID